jgi:hypothetical protein
VKKNRVHDLRRVKKEEKERTGEEGRRRGGGEMTWSRRGEGQEEKR